MINYEIIYNYDLFSEPVTIIQIIILDSEPV